MTTTTHEPEPERPDDPPPPGLSPAEALVEEQLHALGDLYRAVQSERRRTELEPVVAAILGMTSELKRIADALQPVELEPVERVAEPVRVHLDLKGSDAEFLRMIRKWARIDPGAVRDAVGRADGEHARTAWGNAFDRATEAEAERDKYKKLSDGRADAVSEVLEDHDVHRKALADALELGWHLNWAQLIEQTRGTRAALIRQRDTAEAELAALREGIREAGGNPTNVQNLAAQLHMWRGRALPAEATIERVKRRLAQLSHESAGNHNQYGDGLSHAVQRIRAALNTPPADTTKD